MAPQKPGAEGWGFSCSCPTLQHRRWSGGSQVGHCGETLHQEHSAAYLLDRNGSNMYQHNHIAKIAILFPAMQQFRHAVQLFLGNLSPDINLQCVDPTLGGHYTPFPQVRASCPASAQHWCPQTFCPHLPVHNALPYYLSVPTSLLMLWSFAPMHAQHMLRNSIQRHMSMLVHRTGPWEQSLTWRSVAAAAGKMR